MADSDDSVSSLTEGEMEALSAWRQGDFTVERFHFPVISASAHDEIDIGFTDACGWVVITQTCDIVNFGPNKDYVSICPIVEGSEQFQKDVTNGVTPAGAPLELRIQKNHVIDLGRTASIHKRALLEVARKDGFSTDHTRSVFAQCLERRYGRFAFPDWLSTGPLRQLRDRAREKHKTGGPLGDVYKAVDEFRVRGNPDLESHGSAIGFYALVDAEKEKKTTRQDIRKELLELAGKFNWPDAYVKEDEFFTIVTLDEMSAREFRESHAVDLDFISKAK
jgi:hypothetical protein